MPLLLLQNLLCDDDEICRQRNRRDIKKQISSVQLERNCDCQESFYCHKHIFKTSSKSFKSLFSTSFSSYIIHLHITRVYFLGWRDLLSEPADFLFYLPPPPNSKFMNHWWKKQKCVLSFFFFLWFTVAEAAAASEQNDRSDGRMTGSSWRTGDELSGNRRRRQNLLEGKIIGEGADKGAFWGEAGKQVQVRIYLLQQQRRRKHH